MTYNPDSAAPHGAPIVDDDPYASAGTATLRPRDYYGQLSVDAWYCKLVKGQGKVPWDKAADSIDNRVTALTIELQPLADSGVTFALKRELIAESADWVKTTWPSLRACGVQSVKLADGIWVKLVQQETGRSFRGKDGEQRQATTFKILTVYPDQAACEAAYKAAHGDPAADEIQDIDLGDGRRPQAQAQPQATQATMTADDARKRETARQFLLAIARQKHGNLDEVKVAVAAMPMITQAFDPNSNEFMAVVAEAL